MTACKCPECRDLCLCPLLNFQHLKTMPICRCNYILRKYLWIEVLYYHKNRKADTFMKSLSDFDMITNLFLLHLLALPKEDFIPFCYSRAFGSLWTVIQTYGYYWHPRQAVCCLREGRALRHQKQFSTNWSMRVCTAPHLGSPSRVVS